MTGNIFDPFSYGHRSQTRLETLPILPMPSFLPDIMRRHINHFIPQNFVEILNY